MALPERKYYPLSKVAEIVNCDIEDLLHFSAIGLLQICFPIPALGIFINETQEDEYEHVFPKIIRNDVEIIANDEEIYRYRANHIILQEKINSKNETKDLHIQGLLAITHSDINEFYDYYLRSEHQADTFFILYADFPRYDINPFKTVGYEPIGVEFSDEYYIDLHRLVITHHELMLLQSGGKRYSEEEESYINDMQELEYFNKTKTNSKNDYKHNSKTFNLQIDFIRSLLFIKYGNEAIENPRKFIEKKTSELIKDFDLAGLKCPSGKAIESWLKK